MRVCVCLQTFKVTKPSVCLSLYRCSTDARRTQKFPLLSVNLTSAPSAGTPYCKQNVLQCSCENVNIAHSVMKCCKDTYLLNHSLTPCCTVLLQKLTCSQLVKKFPAFYGTRRFITAFTSARHLSLS